jgi:hypothetical protein
MRNASTVALLMLLPTVIVLTACDEQGRTNPASGSITDPTAVAPNLSDGPPPLAVTPLTGLHTFTDDVAVQVRNKLDGRRTTVANLQDASNMIVVEIIIQPGARAPWHTHHGPGMLAVTNGEVVWVHADDCVQRPYAEDTAIVDTGFHTAHMAFNPSGSEATRLVAVFLGVPAGGPVTLPVDANLGAALDAKCGFAAP